MNKRLLSLSIVFLLFTAAVFAQTGTLTGTVTDQSSGEVLPGVNIYIPNLERGTATNAQGEYTIQNIEYGTYLVRATYVGYSLFEEEVTIDQETTTFNISLASELQELDDVVVTAYGIEQSLNELPYSAQQVDTDEITRGRSSNFLSSLNGRVAGLKINQSNTLGGSTNIVMRGYKSVTGNNQVLFVVDGVPYNNHSFNNEDVQEGFAGYDYGNTAVDINPNNIRSLNVLKGPAAAALYGSRASNGAIIIETKKGVPGQEQVRVTINSSVGFSRIDPETFIEYQKEYGGGYVQAFAEEDIDGDGTMDVVSYTQDDASFGPRFDPDLMVYQWDAFSENHPNYQTPTPWVFPANEPIEFFETGFYANNSISIQGGFEGGYYNLGYNQANAEGVLPNSQLDNYKLNFASGYDISDKLGVDASIQYSRTDGKARPETGYSTIMSEFRQWWATNVDIVEQRRAYFRDRTNESWNWGSGRDFPIYWNNPYWDRFENFQEDRRDRYFGYAEATYEVFEWLNLTGRVGIDSYDQLIEERANVGGVASGATPSGDRFDVPYYLQTKESFTEFTYDLLANYSIQPTEQINLEGVVGGALTRNNRQMISTFTNGGLVVPRLYSIDNSLNQIEFPEEEVEEVGINGIFASVNLTYDDFITLQLTGRRDKSSSLPEGENVYYYPSASLGIIFTRFLDVDWLTFGKVRGSWAEVGNTAPPLSIIDTFERETNMAGAGLYTLPDTKNNEDLKPERTKSWEVGLQMRFLNDRFSYDINYYDQNTLDQILATEVSRAAGYAFKFVNAGNVENRGIELTLSARAIEMRDFAWNVAINWNRNLNKVKELAPGIDNYQLASPQGDVTISAALGEPYGAIRGSDYVYHENGEPIVGPSGFYETTTSSNNIIGNMNPDWTGGVQNELRYKNWALNFLVDMRWGGDVFSLDQYYGQGTGLYPITAQINDRGVNVREPVAEGGGIVLDGVKKDGTTNDVYAPAENYAGAFGWINNPSAHFVYDGSYVKLRQVGVTFNIPQTFLDRIGGVSAASVSVVGNNLWIIHKNLPYADPEQGLVAGNVQGYQGAVHPAIRDFTFNVTLEF